ncbi:MAG TPA: glycosyltransferase family 2 protein, partial [Thermoanaerobaculia bacterium]|nr:glycosyltransferase family 2 protein [Thermoanaerobaculia bacterium]
MEPGPQPRVAAIVVNYDGKEVTLDAVASLRRMRYPRFDLVVLDNGSRDGSVEALAAAFPDLRQLRLAENRGSSSGYAAGFRWAFANGYDYALLLNNDVEVEPDLLDELVAAAERDPRAGAVGPKCYFHGEGKRLWSAGGMLRFREAVTRERGYGELDRGQFDEETAVDYVNGCAILVRRAAAEAVGGWDPLYFICVDDADFCTRLARAGWHCLYAPRAVLYHRVAWTTGGYTPGRNFQLGRSSALYVRRYGHALQKARFWAFALAALPVGWLRELPRGNQAAAVAKLRGALA